MKNTAKLIYTCGPDWYWATKMEVSDPHFLYIDTQGEKHAVVGALEYDIARERSKIDHIYSHEEIQKALGDKPANLINSITYLHNTCGGGVLTIAEDFPAFLLKKLEEAGLDIEVSQGLIFPKRMIKTPQEVDYLQAAQTLNQKGFERVEEILTQAIIEKDKTLSWQNAPLTSEIMLGQMNQVYAAAGSGQFAGGPIVAGGEQGAIPHERGHGVLRANELIVVDSFPQHPNHYYGDLTRTYIKGGASAWQKKMYHTVLGAQELALSLVKPEISLGDIQKQVVAYFKENGFDNGVTDKGSYYGYIHGIGHHIGLMVHDGAMQRQASDSILKAGHVITIEPGLYYPKGALKEGFGGCRIEDFVVVTEDGYKNLTSHPKNIWMIK